MRTKKEKTSIIPVQNFIFPILFLHIPFAGSGSDDRVKRPGRQCLRLLVQVKCHIFSRPRAGICLIRLSQRFVHQSAGILYPVISYYIPLPSISQAKPFSKRRLPGIRRILLIFFLNPLAENMALCYYTNVVPVAQLDRALDSDSKGQRFESSRVRHVGTSYARSDFLLHKKSFSRSTVPPLTQ